MCNLSYLNCSCQGQWLWPEVRISNPVISEFLHRIFIYYCQLCWKDEKRGRESSIFRKPVHTAYSLKLGTSTVTYLSTQFHAPLQYQLITNTWQWKLFNLCGSIYTLCSLSDQISWSAKISKLDHRLPLLKLDKQIGGTIYWLNFASNEA